MVLSIALRRTMLAVVVGVALPMARVASRPVSQTAAPELVTQVGHLGRIHSMSYSADGRLLASAGSDRTAKLWDVYRGLLIRSFEGHAGGVRSAELSADARRLVSSSEDGTVRVWEVATGRLLQTLGGERGTWMTGAAFLDAETIVAAQSVDWTDRLARSGDNRNELALWNSASGRKIRRVRLGGQCRVSFSADRSLALCGGELWDTASLKRLNGDETAREMNSGGVRQMGISPNGNLLAVATSYGLDVWDAKRFVMVHHLNKLYAGPYDPLRLTALAFAPDGRTVAAADERGRVVLCDAVTGEAMGVSAAAGSRAQITALAFAPDGRRLVSASEAEFGVSPIAVWRVAERSAFPDGELGLRPHGQPVSVSAVRFSPDGHLLAAGGADARIRMWNLQSGQLARVLNGRPHAIREMAFSRDGRMLVSSGRGVEGLFLWDTGGGGPKQVFESHMVDHVAFHPDGRTIITGDSIQVWDVGSEKARRERWPYCDFVALSADGKVLACSVEFGSTVGLRLIDVSSGKELHTLRGHAADVTSAVFSPDGSRLVTASEDHTLMLWNVNAGRRLATLNGHSAAVLSVAYHPSGSMIASGGADSAIRLWDSNGRFLRTLTGHTNAVNSVAFGPEGMTLASGSADGTLRIWSPNGGSSLATLFAFDDDEWLVYGPHGHYHGSEKLSRYGSWRVGTTVYDFDQFFERFYSPDLLVRIFQGAAPASTGAPAGSVPPPAVVIVAPRPGQSFRDPDIEIALEVKDTGGGIGDVRLALNGKQIDLGAATRELRPSKPATSLLKFRVSLLDGANTLRATAFSADRTESVPHEMTVSLEAPAKEATLRLLAVGISRYQNPSLKLTFPSADARDLVEFFRRTGPRLFRQVDITELSDEGATESSILQALVALQRRSLPQDVIVVFLAGHGASVGSSWYFVPHDLRNPEREDELSAHGLSAVRLAQELRRVSSQKVLLLVDACYSGSMTTAFRGYEDRKALATLARSAGIHVLAAATSDQRASEVAALGHGIFSYALLRGLSGAAALRDVDQQVTVMSLVAYVRSQLPDLGRQYRAEVQDPVIFSNGMDFPLVITR